MKKTILLLLFSMVIGILLNGCMHSPTAQNKEGSQQNQFTKKDDQYCFLKTSRSTCTMAESESGYYFLSGPGNRYLYFLDKKTMMTAVLCNKPDCLHTDETDPARKSICNAFLGDNGDNVVISIGDIVFYDDFIYSYLTVKKNDQPVCYELCQITMDGTQRKIIYTFREDPQYIIIHHDYLYYSVNDNGTVSGNEDTTSSKSGLYRISISNLNSAAECVYEKDGIYANVSNLMGYNDTVYFSCSSYQDSKLQVRNSSLMCYNTTTGQVTMICPQAGLYAICAKKIIYYWGNGGGDLGHDYICDLNGSNVSLLADVIGYPYSDDRYIITDTSLLKLRKLQDAEGNLIKSSLNIYDIDGKKLQSIDIDKLGGAYVFGSDSDYIFVKTAGLDKSGALWDQWLLDKKDITQGNARLFNFFSFVPKAGQSSEAEGD